jgi:two-component system cell cycle sensor histidine kinase/response regulator CckA
MAVRFHPPEPVGTAFGIYFPRTIETAKVSVSLDSNPQTLRGSETVLLREDQTLLRHVVELMLENNGYTFRSADDPLAAHELAQSYGEAIDLLITGVILAGMNGREFADQLLTTRPDMEILFVSGHTENILALGGQSNSVVNLLQKSFTQEVLGRKL